MEELLEHLNFILNELLLGEISDPCLLIYLDSKIWFTSGMVYQQSSTFIPLYPFFICFKMPFSPNTISSTS